MSAHSTAVVRHDVVGQETLLNLLLRNYLHYNLYDQVTQAATYPLGRQGRGSVSAQLLAWWRDTTWSLGSHTGEPL
jgi:hypothetical protein